MAASGSDALLISKRVGEFLGDYAPHARGRSPHTVKSYEDALTLYMEFLETRGVTDATLSREHLGRAWVEDWVRWLRTERGCSNDTCNVRLSSLRSFLDYLGSRDVALRHLYLEAKEVKRLSADNTRVRGMSVEAVEALIAAPGTSTAIGRRDTCFLMLAYTTACRLDEVRRLTVGQLRLDARKPHVTVVGKGGGARDCFLLPKVVRALRSYMAEALGPDAGTSAYLFPSSHGGGPMTEQAWDKRIKTHAKRARETCPDVPDGAHFHQLRHAKASHWLGKDKLNVVEVQHLLGHKHIETTMRYLDIEDEQLADAASSLEGEAERGAQKKWRNQDGTLRGFCGLGGRR